MPFCPNCRAEYRPGFTVCKNCGNVALVAELPSSDALTEEEIDSAEPVGFSDGETAATVEVGGRKIDPTRVFVYASALEVKELLEDASIPAVITPLELDFADQVSRFEVRVRPADGKRASETLHQAWKRQVEQEGVEGGEVSDVETCPACGSHVPLDVEECPDCGLVVGAGSERAGAGGEAGEAGEGA